MMNVLWLVGMLFASQWGWSGPAVNSDKDATGALIGRMPGQEPSPRVVACWSERVYVCSDVVQSDTKVPTLKGSFYLFCGETNKTMCAKGTVHVEACDRHGRKLAEWCIDAPALEKLKRTDLIGVGYSLCLPLDPRCLAEKDLRLTVRYSANDGKPSCYDEPARLTLRSNTTGVIQASFTEMARTTSLKATKQMSHTDIVTLSKRGISDDIIIRQMELTESIYDLTTEQILTLHEQGVSNAVIRAMQDRRAGQATPTPTPYRIHGGVGPASSAI